MTTNKKLQTVEMNPSLAESVRALVQPDISELPELSFQNIVTTGELDMLVASSQQVFKDQPTVKTKLATGAKVEVTRYAAPFEMDGSTHHVRLMKYRTLRKSGEDVYVIFDMTQSPEQLLVRDPSLFRLESGDDVKKGVYVNNGSMVPELNERTHVSFAEWVLGEIVEAGEKHKAIDVQTAKEATEARALQKKQNKRNRSGNWSRKFDDVSYYLPEIALGGLCLAFLGGIGVVIANIEDPIEEFDKKHYELAGGAVAQVGATAVKPEFSFQLLHDENLEPGDIPVVGQTVTDAGPKVEDGYSRNDRTSLKEFRQVQLTTGDSKKKCETTYVHFDSPTDAIRVWTDYQGDPKNLEVSVGNDTVDVCWVGPELDDKETPRVVIKQQVAAK